MSSDIGANIEFDWEAALREIDISCLANSGISASVSNSNTSYNNSTTNPAQETRGKRKCEGNFASISSLKQSKLDTFISVSAGNFNQYKEKSGFSEGLQEKNNRDSGGVTEFEELELLNSFIEIDSEAAKTWIYPVNVPHRDYQFSISKTALFSNTLVVLPTGLGKTLIAATVMYNYFRWFPEGKIVFAAPSRPLVLQQIEACHNIVGIPQEWTIDLTGQMSPAMRAHLWKEKRVFFVTPQVLENDIHSGSCLVKHLVCLVIDEAHRATGNYSYCVAIRELVNAHLQLRILALTATPGCKQQTIQLIIDNLQISTLEYRNESDHDVLPYVHERKIELIEVPMGNDAVEINNMLLEVARSFTSRLCALGVLEKRDFQTLSPCDLLKSRDKFRQGQPPDLPKMKYGDIEGYFGVLITLSHLRKLLSSHGIKPAFEMLDEKLKQGYFVRLVSRNEILLKAKLLMHTTVSHGAPSPKLTKMLDVLNDHFKVRDPDSSRVIIFSNFRGSVRDIMEALTNMGEFVKATEFIGQSSGKAFKGQSQKVQQAVLQKFRTGGYNVIVATSIGEEGLDIMEVDLVICFDANISPLRMIQRMGRTGRKHKGRVVVLACEGSELKGYMRKQSSSKSINKHLQNGGLRSFKFHPSPRMVPHCFKPDVKFLKMNVEQFVPRGKRAKDVTPILVPTCKTKLMGAERDLLAKYFPSDVEFSWKPSLIAFPHYQAFPSFVNEVAHSSRTSMLIESMLSLQSLLHTTGGKINLIEDELALDLCLSAEVNESPVDIVEDKSPAEVQFRTPVTEISIKEIPNTKEMHTEFTKQKTYTYLVLFPQFSPQSRSKIINSGSEYYRMHDFENKEENPELEKVNLALQLIQFPITGRNSNEFSTYDFEDPDLSPRLTDFIKSGFVPESPMRNGKSNDEVENAVVQDHISFPPFQSSISMTTGHYEEDGSFSKTIAEETKVPFAWGSESSCSEDWVADSGEISEVQRPCQFRRLRKRDDHTEAPPKSKSLIGLKRKQAKDAAVYINDEAAVSSETAASDDEEDEQNSSSYDDSFIDDGVNSASADTQPGISRTDMMAVYRRSLLSQSPFQTRTNLPASLTPDSVVQRTTMNGSDSSASAQIKHGKVCCTASGLDSTSTTSKFTCERISVEISNECGLESWKMRPNFYQIQSVLNVNLDMEFAETVSKNPSLKLEVERPEDNLCIFEDDLFYEGINLDALEEEAAQLLRSKPECSKQKSASPDRVPQNPGILGSPSFDLGV